jgi:hypothetical protein
METMIQEIASRRHCPYGALRGRYFGNEVVAVSRRA